MNIFDASRFFTIDTGNMDSIEPDLPLYIRYPFFGRIRQNFDYEFVVNEALATLWDIAFSIHSPCINRPTLGSSIGDVLLSTCLLERQMKFSSSSKELYLRYFPETLTSERWTIQDQATFDTSVFPIHPMGNGPYKARSTENGTGYEIVAVVERQAWRSTKVPLERLQLEKRSIEIIEKLKLNFGAITWFISDNSRESNIARIDAQPTIEQLFYVLDSVFDALLEVLVA